MRELIIKRIEEIRSKEYNKNFSKGFGRWNYAKLNEVHISELNFEELSDEDLFYIFEIIIMKYYQSW